MLRTRALVALVALPLLALVTALGGTVFALVLLAVLAIAGWEYTGLLRRGGYQPALPLLVGLVALPVATTWYDKPGWQEPGLIALLVAGAWLAVMDWQRGSAQPVQDLALTVFGGVYLGWLGSKLLAVRLLPEGAFLTVLLYGIVAFSDTAAYFVGSQWGRHKLAPRISPKKTQEGYVGGIVGALVFGMGVAALAPSDVITWGDGAALGLLIGVLGTLGDLFISTIKRQVNVKDSSQLIPGHGGMLDRLDSVLISAAVGYYYLNWIVF